MVNNCFKELLHIHHCNAFKLKDVFDCSYATAWKKTNDPSRLTAKDIFAMEKCGVASAGEILEALRKDLK